MLVLSFHGLPARSLRARRPLPLPMPEDGAPAGASGSACRATEYQRHLPEPLRHAHVARALHRADAAQAGARKAYDRVDVICPGFVADCLETLEEIEHEGARRVPRRRRQGVPLHPVPQRPARHGSPRWPGSRCATCRVGRPNPNAAELQQRRERAGPSARGAECRAAPRCADHAARPRASWISRGSTSTATTIASSSADTGRCEEHAPAALADRQRVAHLRFGQRPEDHADDHRRGREVEAPHQHAEQADAVQQDQVERALAHAVDADRREDQDAGVELRLAGSSAA